MVKDNDRKVLSSIFHGYSQSPSYYLRNEEFRIESPLLRWNDLKNVRNVPSFRKHSNGTYPLDGIFLFIHGFENFPELLLVFFFGSYDDDFLLRFFLADLVVFRYFADQVFPIRFAVLDILGNEYGYGFDFRVFDTVFRVVLKNELDAGLAVDFGIRILDVIDVLDELLVDSIRKRIAVYYIGEVFVFDIGGSRESYDVFESEILVGQELEPLFESDILTVRIRIDMVCFVIQYENPFPVADKAVPDGRFRMLIGRVDVLDTDVSFANGFHRLDDPWVFVCSIIWKHRFQFAIGREFPELLRESFFDGIGRAEHENFVDDSFR